MKFHPTLSRSVTFNDIDHLASLLETAVNPRVTFKVDATREQMLEEVIVASTNASQRVLNYFNMILEDAIPYASQNELHQNTQTETTNPANNNREEEQ